MNTGLFSSVVRFVLFACTALFFLHAGFTGCRPTTVNKDGKVTPVTDAGGTDTPPGTDTPIGTEKVPVSGLRVTDLQDPKSANHPKPKQAVRVKGVIVTSSTFTVSSKGKLKGFFIGDPAFPGKWGGILVVIEEADPIKLSIGDVIDVTGVYQETFGNSQLEAKLSAGGSIDKTGDNKKDSIKAAVVGPKDLVAIPATKDDPDSSVAEPYEGVLVEMKDVEVETEADNFGVFKIKGGAEVDDTFFRFKPKKGDKIPFIRGILHYAFNKYTVLPRFAKDISGAKPECTKDEDCFASSKCNVEEQRCKTIVCQKDSDCKTGTKCNTTTTRCEKPQQTLTIVDVQDPGSAKHPQRNDPVEVKGVIVVTETFTVSTKGKLKGFFVADPGFPAKWGGVLVVIDEAYPEKLPIGTVIDIVGKADAAFGNTQINATSAKQGKITKGTDNKKDQIKATVVKSTDVVAIPTDKNDPDKSPAEPYEGMFVEIQNAEVDAPADKYGVVKLVGGAEVDDTFFKGFQPQKGDKVKFIRGVVNYAFNKYSILPRSAADIDGAVAPTKCTKDDECKPTEACDTKAGICRKKTPPCTKDTDCQSGEKCNTTTGKCESAAPATTVTLADLQDAKSAKHPKAEAKVVIKGVIVTTQVFDLGSTLKAFFVMDPSGPSKFGGAMIVVPKTYADTLAIGDEVDIEGIKKEYFFNTQVDLSKSGKVTKTGKNNAAAVKPLVVAAKDIQSKPADPKAPDTSGAEQYEGMLVEIKNVEVSDEPDKYGVWKLKEGIDVDDTIFKFAAKKGSKITSLIGVVQYAFGSYKILPRSAKDITVAP